MNELVGSKEHGRSFLATALFILGTEIDREHLMSFMLEQGLFGMQIFEHLLQNRDYCDAYYTFRKLEKAFMASPAEEEKQLRTGSTSSTRNSEENLMARSSSKPRIKTSQGRCLPRSSRSARSDGVHPWSMCLNNSLCRQFIQLVRSMKIMARHFERFANGEETKEQANQEIGDHLLAFARQFSADSKAGYFHNAA